MDNQNLTILARIKAAAGKEEELYGILKSLVPLTRAEEGCISYNLHRAQGDPALFCFCENWRSKKDLDDHFATPYLQTFLGKADQLLAEPPDITFWDQIA